MTDGPAKVRFLWGLSEKFEKDGNVSESFKSAQTALLLQHSLGEEYEPQFDTPTYKAANQLVLKCNATAVEHFQSDQYDVASFLLDRALFLTNDTPATNCFGPHTHDRLRLRAATYNNLGCLEKRRNNFEAALELLQKAVEVECLVDRDVGPSASTHLNLCTVLNKLGRHQQAATAAERAIRSLKFQAQQGHENFPHYAQMLAMAHYNFGVSLEFSSGPGDLSRALESYRTVIDVSQKYLDRGQTNLAEIASQAIQRIQQATGAVTPTGTTIPITAMIGGRPSTQPAMGSQGKVMAITFGTRRTGGDEDTVGSSSSYTPRPPSTPTQPGVSKQGQLVRAKLLPHGFLSPAPTAGGSSKGGGRIDEAMSKHTERIMSRQKRQQAIRERDEIALKRAQMAHVKEKQDKLKREKELEEQRREEMANALYEKMVAGLRAEEVRKIKNAAKKIQKVWRGYLVRDYMRTLLASTIKIQSVYRSHACRRNLRIQKELQKVKEMDERRHKMQHKAAIVIQRRVRLFLRRLNIIRTRKANKLRRTASARRIQRCYRRHRRRVEQRIIDRLEAERKADQERQLYLHRSATKIQRMYRAFKSRRFLRVVRSEQTRRNAAATTIQALMRGALTRVWFHHYKLYRRQQELSTSKNLIAIRKIQRQWRMSLAKMTRRRLMLEKYLRDRNLKIFKSALCIQCAWRSYIARCRATVRRVAQRRRVAAAKKIQSRWRVYLTRKAYLFRLVEVRLMRSLKEIQRWGRAMMVRKKHMETARYHAKLRKDGQIALVRTGAAVTIQTYIRTLQSQRLRAKLLQAWLYRSKFAAVIQAAGRFYKAQNDMRLLQRITYLVRKQAAHEELCRVSATKIQKYTRGYLARVEAHRRRKQRVVALHIQCAWRQFLARKELRRRQQAKRAKQQDKAARRIQKSVRLFLKRQELKRLDAYYTERQRQRLLAQRREEAAICIQSHWKGFATRKAVGAQRSRMLQNTIDAIRIQRAFRTYRFRRGINEEIQRRTQRKQRRHSSATQIQAVWRGVLAREYAVMLRERTFNHSVAAIVIQCAWRCARARLERKIRKAQRLLEQQLTAKQHDRAVLTADKVNAVLRSRLDQQRRIRKMEHDLSHQLSEKKRLRALYLYNKATKIEAWYRGCYERVYVRGLLREKRERDAIAAAKFAKETRAALRIQCAVRSYWARRIAQKRRYDRMATAQLAQMERERTADPANIIKSLFWVHEASVHRNLTQERVERTERQNQAATMIGKTIRMFLCKRRFLRLKREREQKEAANRIQKVWRKHDATTAAARAEASQKSAVKIQATVRMFLVKLHWAEKVDELRQRRGSKVKEEERRDNAATQIQATWRRVLAQRKAAVIRRQRSIVKRDQRQDEAALLIQKQYRRHLAQRRVKGIRAQQAAKPKTLVPAPPKSRGDGPVPPPRRRSGASE